LEIGVERMPRMSPEAQAAGKVLALPQIRPDPPASLTPEEAGHWRSIVERMPANWFLAETLAVLEDYCITIERRRMLTTEVRALQKKGRPGKLYYMALKAEDAAIGRTVSLATKLRLTPQSTKDKRTTKPIALRNPWDDKE
jgi:phage terminase small subunit